MDAIERNSDSIDKLTSLVRKMNVKMDKREAPYKPQIYQGNLEAKVEIGNQIPHPIIDLSVGIGIEIEGITTTGII